VAGRYAIERELGRGGMATVYLARDVRHDRLVALKVLRPDIAVAIGAERFLAEIHTTARLQHPHILPLFDSGAAEGYLYYVMPFVTGESLRDRLARHGTMAPAEVERIMREVGGALDYAHRQGVIHRDIKPANILIHDGAALLADFGIARVASEADGDRLTETGMSIGTPQYMSPEQASGEDGIGPASDQYSLGVVAYELLTGQLPFSGSSLQAVLARILTSSPTPLTVACPDLPAQVNAAVLRSLAREPGDRFPDCDAFSAALGVASTVAAPRAMASAPGGRAWLRPALIGGTALVAALGAWRLGRRPAAPTSSGRHVLAVLPFTNLTGDTANEYFGRGLAVEITDELHRLGVNVVGSGASTVAARRFASGSEVDVQAAGRSLGADAVLDGALLPSSGGGRMNVELTDVRSQQVLWSEQYRLEGGLFAMQDSVATRVAAALRITLSPSDVAAVQRGRSGDAAAHDQVVRAKGYVDRRDVAGLDQAIALFADAIRRDSGYAEAWSGLAEANSLRGVFSDVDFSEYFRRARTAAERALVLDSSSAAVHRVRGFLAVLHDYDWRAAEREFRTSIALDSTQAATWLFRGWYYYAMNERDSVLWALRRARALDSLTPIYSVRLGDMLREAGDTSASRKILELTVRRNPADPLPRMSYAALLATEGACDSALATFPATMHGSPGVSQMLPEVWVHCGYPGRVRAMLDSAAGAGGQGGAAPGVLMALAAALLHDRARLDRWLDHAVVTRDWAAFFLRSRAFENFADDPHYLAALESFGLR
jgi:serine/threonine-protein kinase